MPNELPNRKLTRLKEFDYTNPSYYFVTICTKNHEHFFGKVENEKMFLNQAGEIVKNVWLRLKEHFKIEIDEYCIMPNHFHGIIILEETNKHSLSAILGSFKSFATREIRMVSPSFNWQKSFYDRIIRNEKELYQIRKYIQQNPLKWDLEKNLPDNLEI